VTQKNCCIECKWGKTYMNKENYPIDIVITWVDGNDPAWRAEKNKYSGKMQDTREIRYREWDNLQYWFRAIENNAKWVNKIFFVTWGHMPKWLNTDNPNLVVVKHEDFIPHEFLPTFSNRTIEFNLHRIKGLSEHFVYFNDDMFLISPTTREDFFVNGLPCDTAMLRPVIVYDSPGKKEKPHELFIAPLVDMLIINRYFNKRESIRKNWRKWFSLKYGKGLFHTLLMLPWPYFTGMQSYHTCYSLLKSTFEEVWHYEEEAFNELSARKFRTNLDYNSWIFSFWQIAKGSFWPRRTDFGKMFRMGSDNKVVKQAEQAILTRKYKMICINDSVDNNSDFESIKRCINSAFEKLFPEKSSYEK